PYWIPLPERREYVGQQPSQQPCQVLAGFHFLGACRFSSGLLSLALFSFARLGCHIKKLTTN
ncbi:hypothetical protein, partial [Thalassolituus sp.]|uniref:hypothetical protein n=1 Tax=Thalassolituus sp. TaxID=2030822 RepID=UPI003514BB70